MPIRCPGGKKPRYRVNKDKVRLAFCGNRVEEAKSLRSGKTHTQAEFRRDRRHGRNTGRGGTRR